METQTLVDACLPADPSAVGKARQRVDMLKSQLPEANDDLLAALRLAVSELVTNSVRYGSCHQDEVALRISRAGDELRVEVRDSGAGFSGRPEAPDDDQTHGRGLLIVESLAQRWGICHSSQTCVWAEFAL